MNNAVTVENLTKIFSGKGVHKEGIRALDNVSFNIEKGLVFGLLGPNGAGKTTLIKILLGIVFPSSGSATILGENIRNYKIREQIGYLPENHKFPNYLTGEEVIIYNSKLSGLNIDKNSPKVDEVLKLVKMEKWRKTKVKKYSKGMLQRLGIAQAIIHDPDLIFLDEPTDGVDPIGRKEIRDILVDLKNQGKTIFINSHLLSEVELVSDKVAILNDGKLVKFGTVEELTIDKQICEIKIEDKLSEQLTDILRKKYLFNLSDSLVSLEISNNDDLNNFLDDLRNEGIRITGVNQKKTSLEDLFIKSLTEKEN